MVKLWNARTSPQFRFSAKFPRVITHEKKFRNCESELEMLKVENEEKMHQVETASSRSEYLEAELIELREEEQRIIETAGGSYSVLQEYERRIKALSEQERHGWILQRT